MRPSPMPIAAAPPFAQIEAGASLPPGLLTAVAVSESGKYDPGRRGVAPWPWTVNNQGDGRYFATAAEAIAHVAALQRSGRAEHRCRLHADQPDASPGCVRQPGGGVRARRTMSAMGRSSCASCRTRRNPGRGRSSVTTPRTSNAAGPIARRSTSAGRPPAPTRRPEVAQPAGAMELAGLPGPSGRGAADAAAISGSAPADAVGQPRFPRLTDAPTRVAVLRPSPVSQLKPIVRMPRPAAGTLVRLQPLRRALASSVP